MNWKEWLSYNPYKKLWFWAGRPFTYILRDIWHRAEFIWIVGLVSLGVWLGHYYDWRATLYIFLIFAVGFIFGHLFWTENYIEGQKVGDSVKLAYLAGLFDGEGSIIIRVKKTGKYINHTVQCRVGNTDKNIPLLFHNKYGGSLVSEPSKGNLPSWNWEVNAVKANSFLREIHPFLGSKQHEAQVAIEFQDERKSMTITDREQVRIRLHELKGNKRLLKDYTPMSEGKRKDKDGRQNR